MLSANKILCPIAERNYRLARLLWKRRQQRELAAQREDPIINYQMGKVGSSTVQASLEALNLNRLIYHVHHLNPIRVHDIEQQRRHYFRTEKYCLLKRAWLCEFLYEQALKKSNHWRLISLVRDPIARNVSTFFENLEVSRESDSKRYRVKSDYYRFEIELAENDLDPLIELFLERMFHDRPIRYFDDELKGVFGIDVFASGFPHEKGYEIYHGENADLLLIRLEDLDRCCQAAFKEFMAIDNFSLIQANIGEAKIYAPIYSEFKRMIRLPSEYIEKMYNSDFAKAFYSEREIQQFRDRWTR